MALTSPAPILRLLPHRPARRSAPQHATGCAAPAAAPVAPVAAAVPAPAPRRTPVLGGSAQDAATSAAAAWPAAARGLLVDLAVAALATSALAEQAGAWLPGSAASTTPAAGGSSARRARALAEHLADTCAGLRTDLTVQQLVVLPVLRTAPLGLRTAVVRASCEAVVLELEAVERGASLLTEGLATAEDLRLLAAALRRTRSAVALHRRLWTDQALPLAREVLRERADRVGR